MEHLDMVHLPHNAPVSYQEVQKEELYSAKHIHMHNTHEINLIVSPSLCRIRCNGTLCQVQGPAVIVQKRGTYHAILSATGPFESRVIYFDPNAVSLAEEKYLQKKALFSSDFAAISLNEKELLEFLSLFEAVKKEEGDARLFLVLAILAKTAQLSEKSPHGMRFHTKNTYIFSLIQSIQDRLGESLTIEGLAKEFHVSPTKLKGDFHRITGSPVKSFITSQRLHLAKTLLSQGDAPLSQIALTCGFSGESHLIRSFREAFGTTPGAWRKGK